MDHLERSRIDLSDINTLVLDEADRMLDMGFVDDVKYIASLCNKQKQTLLFSATIDNKMEKFASALLKNPARIKVEAERTNHRKIQQSVYITDGMQHKIAILSHILKQEPIFKGIIFTATKSVADDLTKQLVEQGHRVAAMHGDKRQAQRIRTLEQLRNGKLQLIVATDVAARGIDVNNITHVINFDMPKFAEDYVHRIGRTGRADQSGIAITLATYSEKRHLQNIEQYIGQSIVQTVIEGLEPKAKFSSDKPQAKRGYGKGKPQSGRAPAGRSYSGQRSSATAGRATGERSERNFGGRATGERSERNFGGRATGERSERNFANRATGERSERNFGNRATGERSERNFANRATGERSERNFGNRATGERSERNFANRATGERNSAGRSSSDRFANKNDGGAQNRGFAQAKPTKARSSDSRGAKPQANKISIKPKKVVNY
jgi:superfamily II DNA/RNA helicase